MKEQDAAVNLKDAGRSVRPPVVDRFGGGGLDVREETVWTNVADCNCESIDCRGIGGGTSDTADGDH